MQIPSCLAWKKDFYFFNTSGHLDSKSLNLFQRVFRVLGFYSNTRLSVVGTLAYEACFAQNQIWSTEEKKTITALVKKFTKPTWCFTMPCPLRHCYLGEELLSAEETVRYEGNLYDYEDPLPHQGYSFCIKIIKNNKTIRESHVALEKAINNRFTIQRIQEWQIGPTLNEIPFLTDPDDVLVRVTYLFLLKIVNDSNYLSGLDVIDNASSTTSQIGGADVAKTYGFSGKVKHVFIEGGQQIERPDNFSLEKITAMQYPTKSGLSKPVSVDFLLS